MISEISEQELIKEILGDFINLDAPFTCDLVIQDLSKKKEKNLIVKKLVINIIKLYLSMVNIFLKVKILL